MPRVGRAPILMCLRLPEAVLAAGLALAEAAGAVAEGLAGAAAEAGSAEAGAAAGVLAGAAAPAPQPPRTMAVVAAIARARSKRFMATRWYTRRRAGRLRKQRKSTLRDVHDTDRRTDYELLYDTPRRRHLRRGHHRDFGGGSPAGVGADTAAGTRGDRAAWRVRHPLPGARRDPVCACLAVRAHCLRTRTVFTFGSYPIGWFDLAAVVLALGGLIDLTATVIRLYRQLPGPVRP